MISREMAMQSHWKCDCETRKPNSLSTCQVSLIVTLFYNLVWRIYSLSSCYSTLCASCYDKETGTGNEICR